MLGVGIIAGCRLARCPDRLFAATGAIVAAITVGWAFEGAEDMGFTFPRITIVMGCLLGLVEASRHIYLSTRPVNTPSRVAAPAAPRRVPAPAAPRRVPAAAGRR
jgi:hypothetical protein